MHSTTTTTATATSTFTQVTPASPIRNQISEVIPQNGRIHPTKPGISQLRFQGFAMNAAAAAARARNNQPFPFLDPSGAHHEHSSTPWAPDSYGQRSMTMRKMPSSDGAALRHVPANAHMHARAARRR
jgi:hypothetical protein